LLYIFAMTTLVLTPSGAARANDGRYSGLPDSNREAYSRQTGEEAEAVSLVDVQYSSYDAPRFEFTSAFVYLKPGSGSLEYGTLVSPLPPLSPHWENQTMDPNYGSAFSLGARYMVPETGNDLRTSWTHLNSTDAASFAGTALQFAGPQYLIGPGGNAYNLGAGNVNFRYDTVNFEAGHTASAPPEHPVLGLRSSLATACRWSSANKLRSHVSLPALLLRLK